MLEVRDEAVVTLIVVVTEVKDPRLAAVEPENDKEPDTTLDSELERGDVNEPEVEDDELDELDADKLVLDPVLDDEDEEEVVVLVVVVKNGGLQTPYCG